MQLKLTNSPKVVTMDDHVYEALMNDPELVSGEFWRNVRLGPNGYPTYTRTHIQMDGTVRLISRTLQGIIAESFLDKPERRKKGLLVNFKNGDKLDCRVENLEWAKASKKSESKGHSSTTGYKGVYWFYSHFVAMITYQGKQTRIGKYATAEEAAQAYNDKAKELLGPGTFLNVIGKPKLKEGKEMPTVKKKEKRAPGVKKAPKKVFVIEVHDRKPNYPDFNGKK